MVNRYNRGGGQQTGNAICILALNMINDKVAQLYVMLYYVFDTFVKKNLVICVCVCNGQQTGNAICILALNMINDKVLMESFKYQQSINL